MTAQSLPAGRGARAARLRDGGSWAAVSPLGLVAGGESEFGGATDEMPCEHVRPQLRLVGGRAAEHRRPELMALHPKAIRITRAGRLALTVTIVVVFGVGALSMLSATAAPLGSAIDHSVMVRAGESLSAVAARELPDLSVGESMARIQYANRLVSSAVHAGQLLLIPVGR